MTSIRRGHAQTKLHLKPTHVARWEKYNTHDIASTPTIQSPKPQKFNNPHCILPYPTQNGSNPPTPSRPAPPTLPPLIPPQLLLPLPQQILHRKIQPRLHRAPPHHLTIDVHPPRRLVILLVHDEHDAVLRLASDPTGGDDVIGAWLAVEGGAVRQFGVGCGGLGAGGWVTS